jgi:hypothetical protein
MATDEEYMAFLEKANQDPNEGYPKVQSTAAPDPRREFKTVDEGEEIPDVLKQVTTDKFYTTDADEPFVPVVLRWHENGKGLPDEGRFWHKDLVYLSYVWREGSEVRLANLTQRNLRD